MAQWPSPPYTSGTNRHFSTKTDVHGWYKQADTFYPQAGGTTPWSWHIPTLVVQTPLTLAEIYLAEHLLLSWQNKHYLKEKKI